MKKYLILTFALFASVYSFAQLGQKMMSKMMSDMTADAGKIIDTDASSAVVYPAGNTSIALSKIDGSVENYRVSFPLTPTSVQNTDTGSPYQSDANYSIYVRFAGTNECLLEQHLFYQSESIQETFIKYTKNNSSIEYEIDGDYLHRMIGDRLDDCKWPEGEQNVVFTLETIGKKSATIVISKKSLPIDSKKGSALYEKYMESVLDSWNSGMYAATVSDEDLIVAVEKHLEKSWKYNLTTVNINSVVYTTPKEIRFEGFFIAKDPSSKCVWGDMFGTATVLSSGAYSIQPGNNSMGHSDMDCAIADQLVNR